MNTENNTDQREHLSSITTEQLLANGWTKNERDQSFIFPFEKDLVDKESENYNPELGELKMVIHMFYNTPRFALLLPDGAMLHLNPASIEELNTFERLIAEYEPNY